MTDFRGPVHFCMVQWFSGFLVIVVEYVEAGFLGAHSGFGVCCVTLGKLTNLSVHQFLHL